MQLYTVRMWKGCVGTPQDRVARSGARGGFTLNPGDGGRRVL